MVVMKTKLELTEIDNSMQTNTNTETTKHAQTYQDQQEYLYTVSKYLNLYGSAESGGAISRFCPMRAHVRFNIIKLYCASAGGFTARLVPGGSSYKTGMKQV